MASPHDSCAGNIVVDGAPVTPVLILIPARCWGGGWTMRHAFRKKPRIREPTASLPMPGSTRETDSGEAPTGHRSQARRGYRNRTVIFCCTQTTPVWWKRTNAFLLRVALSRAVNSFEPSIWPSLSQSACIELGTNGPWGVACQHIAMLSLGVGQGKSSPEIIWKLSEMRQDAASINESRVLRHRRGNIAARMSSRQLLRRALSEMGLKVIVFVLWGRLT